MAKINRYLVTLAFLLISNAYAGDLRERIAVVDTGLSYGSVPSIFLCKDGHKDLSNTTLEDSHWHGTLIISIIAKGINPVTQCITMIKWINYPIENISNSQTIKRVAEALEYAITLHPKYVNLSLSGGKAYKPEHDAIQKLLEQGAVIVVAAGNDGIDLSKSCNIYPACYKFNSPRFKVVANYDIGIRHIRSNYNGPVNEQEDGSSVGTSKSAAVFLSKYIKGINENEPTIRFLRPDNSPRIIFLRPKD